MQAGPTAARRRGDSQAIKTEEGYYRSSASPIWLDPSQAIRTPQGPEAGVGSRKSGRGSWELQELQAVNPHGACPAQAARGPAQAGGGRGLRLRSGEGLQPQPHSRRGDKATALVSLSGKRWLPISDRLHLGRRPSRGPSTTCPAFQEF